MILRGKLTTLMTLLCLALSACAKEVPKNVSSAPGPNVPAPRPTTDIDETDSNGGSAATSTGPASQPSAGIPTHGGAPQLEPPTANVLPTPVNAPSTGAVGESDPAVELLEPTPVFTPRSSHRYGKGQDCHIYFVDQLASDTQSTRIVCVKDLSGAGWTVFDNHIAPDKLLNGVSRVFKRNGKIYLADAKNSRVVRMDDMTGAGWITLGQFGAEGKNHFRFPIDLFVDEHERIYILDNGLNPRERKSKWARSPKVVRVDDMSGTNWVEFGSFNPTDLPGRFFNPTGLTVEPRSGRVFVADGWGLPGIRGAEKVDSFRDLNGVNWFNELKALEDRGDLASRPTRDRAEADWREHSTAQTKYSGKIDLSSGAWSPNGLDTRRESRVSVAANGRVLAIFRNEEVLEAKNWQRDFVTTVPQYTDSQGVVRHILKGANDLFFQPGSNDFVYFAQPGSVVLTHFGEAGDMNVVERPVFLQHASDASVPEEDFVRNAFSVFSDR